MAAGEECGGRKSISWKPVALDGGYGWVVVFGSFLIHVFADGFVYSFGVIAESLIKEFNASNAEVSTILSLLTGLMLATGPLASAICNRIGCRVTTIVGAIIASIGCALSYYAYSMTYLILSVGIVMGTGFGLMYCPAIVIVTMYFEKYRALATGVTVCGAGVGTFLFSKIIGHLIVAFDWRTVFIIYAGMVLFCVPCGALYKPIQFEPIYDEKDPIEKFREKTEEKKALLAKSQSNGTTITSLPGSRKKMTSINTTHAEPIPEAEERSSDEDLRAANATSAEPVIPSVVNTPAQVSKQSSRRHKFTRRFSKDEEGSPEEVGEHSCIRTALSQACVDCSKEEQNGQTNRGAGGGALQRFLSLGEHLHTRAADGEKISISTGYLNVRDVFYHGSITALPEYNQARFRSVSSLQSQKEGGIGSRGISKSRQELVPQKIDEKETEDEEDKEEDSAATSASRAIDIWRTVKRLMDLSLLADPVYLLFAISNFLTSIGFNAPPMFMPMNAEAVLGFSKPDAASTVSAYGLANLLGRIAFGMTCDRKFPFRWGKDCARNRLWIYNLALMFCGLASCFTFCMNTFHTFTSYCFFFGFTISSYVCLTSVVLVDLVGVNKLTNAFGLLLFIQGIATFVGPPLAGQLYDLTKKYDWTFTFCGICLFVSGAMLFSIPYIQTHKQQGRPSLVQSKCRLEDGLSNGKTPLVEEP